MAGADPAPDGPPAPAAPGSGYISLTVSCRALSTSSGSTPSSLAVCFSALVTVCLIASSTLLSPTMIGPRLGPGR
jgi:hypothetical protein